MRQMLVITQLTRSVGNPEAWRIQWRAYEFQDYYPIPLTWRSFKLGCTDHDAPTAEAHCPCGAVVPVGAPGIVILGDFADAATGHIAEAHPGVRRA